MTSKDVRVYLGISQTTLWKIRKSGEIPYLHFGKKILFKKSDIDAFIERHTVPAKKKD